MMKRLFAFILIITLISSAAFADFDLSALSFSELVELREKLMVEIMTRPEWSETEVDAGSYIIGLDIPEGIYKISPKNSYVTLAVYEGSKEIKSYGVFGEDIGKLILYNGQRMEIDATIIMMPFTGI